ncbi:hypothetical protein L1987_35798 [Smallanthus sonchifolius]|uniref:Uncharacterized protein n=1 Tax=Smallanthus sonchifolius TaxID=185202 RepID=A0ACB9HCL1_9ASTR|nr:hypothetical protein L1987_35798 [Smallanthus sonchifolius]
METMVVLLVVEMDGAAGGDSGVGEGGSGSFVLLHHLFDFSIKHAPLFLKIMDMIENQLQGSLPSNFCLSQPHLAKIELGMNHFNGFLPSSISNCSELEILDVSTNDLKGEIAIDFGRLQHLRLLYLCANYFECKDLDDMKIFHSLSNCNNLKNIDLSSNLLRRVLPNSLGNFSSKLAYLGMHSNYISGSIPSSVGNLLGLTSVSLGQNNFTGIIPESIGKLQNLQERYLDTNHLSGVIPTSLGNLSLVIIVALCQNNWEGTIPSTIGSCKSLIALDLDGNKLSGSVPKELFQLSSLSIVLDLSQNNLPGVLPQEIGNLKLLESLDFSMNRFIGLHFYARRALNDGFVLQIVDPMLLNEDVDEKSLISSVKIGVQCSYESPQDRMDIGTVVHELFASTDSLAHAVADEVDGILFALFEE